MGLTGLWPEQRTSCGDSPGAGTGVFSGAPEKKQYGLCLGKSPPLPLGEGRGEGKLVTRQKLGSRILLQKPSP